jgi:hypothetical protein
VPIGFITGQLATERLQGESRARAAVARDLPTGQVTFLLTDIEDSTGLLRRLGDGYADLLSDVRRLLRRAVQRSSGSEVDVRADELFAVFKRPAGALDAALAMQRSVGSRAWPDGASARVRIGIHTGRPTLTDSGYVGLSLGHERDLRLKTTSEPRGSGPDRDCATTLLGNKAFPSGLRASAFKEVQQELTRPHVAYTDQHSGVWGRRRVFRPMRFSPTRSAPMSSRDLAPSRS